MTTNTIRFPFGKNWFQFVEALSHKQIDEAQQSLQQAFQMKSFRDQTFLDAGCGSGLFSLAARNLKAKVHSFDYDPKCLKATKHLKTIHRFNDKDWGVERGDLLNREYMCLGRFSLVYCWGTLHHTGDMWQALINLCKCVKDDGLLCISLYNDQGLKSDFWWHIKRYYNTAPKVIQITMACLYYLTRVAFSVLRGRNPLRRGMNMYRDAVDWVGGFPFETAIPCSVVAYCKVLGFDLIESNVVGKKSGCNEFLFKKRKRNNATNRSQKKKEEQCNQSFSEWMTWVAPARSGAVANCGPRPTGNWKRPKSPRSATSSTVFAPN
jgi:2-polyprenyl-6-hydroxyphenyl methylase/3-demethylubiquinone-9 3-methyltransferase